MSSLAMHVFGLAFLAQALIPAGYMPASAAAGWPLQLCPDGLSQAAVSALLGHHHHHQDHHPASTLGDCELAGWVFDTSASPAVLEVGVQVGIAVQALPLMARVTPVRRAHRTRAPPIS